MNCAMGHCTHKVSTHSSTVPGAEGQPEGQEVAKKLFPTCIISPGTSPTVLSQAQQLSVIVLLFSTSLHKARKQQKPCIC